MGGGGRDDDDDDDAGWLLAGRQLNGKPPA